MRSTLNMGHRPITCAVECPKLVERLSDRFGGHIALVDPSSTMFREAPILLVGVEDFVGGAPTQAHAPVAVLVVVIARAPDEALEAALLRGGADEVLDEMRSDALLLARLNALCSRHLRSYPAALRCGRWTIDFERGCAHDGATKVALTWLEARLLHYLARHGGEVGARELLDRVFGYSERVETHTLETHVYRLRQKLEADPRKPRLLRRSRQGYYLVGGSRDDAERTDPLDPKTDRTPCHAMAHENRYGASARHTAPSAR